MFVLNEECRCKPRSKYNDLRKVSFETINRFEWPTVMIERDAIGRMHIGESKEIFVIEKPLKYLQPTFDWDEPICRVCHKGQLRFGQIAGGQEWGVCRHCEFIGDPIDYYAAITKTTLEDAITQLATELNWQHHRKVTARRWCQMQTQHREKTRWADIYRAIDTPVSGVIPREYWRYFDPYEGLGGQLHITHYKHAESMVHPRLQKENSIKCNTSPHRVFCGAGWQFVEVIPLRDAPGHVSGLIFRSCSLERWGENIMRLFPTPGCHTRDPGLIIRKELLESKPDPKRVIILCHHDLDEYFMLQARHYRESSRFPNTAFWFTDWEGDEETRTRNFSWLKGNRLIFWMPTWDIRVFRQAALVDAEIALIHPEHDINRPFHGALVGDYRYRAESTLRIIEQCNDYWGDYLFRASKLHDVEREFKLPPEIYRKWRDEYQNLYPS